jgi:hypothetical protein
VLLAPLDLSSVAKREDAIDRRAIARGGHQRGGSFTLAWIFTPRCYAYGELTISIHDTDAFIPNT